MVTVQIGTSGERRLEEADESWINQQINRRRAEGQPVCVRVSIQTDGLHMSLSTPSCAGNGGGGRAPNAREQQVFDLWQQRGLNSNDFTGGNVVAFLKQLDRWI